MYNAGLLISNFRHGNDIEAGCCLCHGIEINKTRENDFILLFYGHGFNEWNDHGNQLCHFLLRIWKNSRRLPQER